MTKYLIKLADGRTISVDESSAQSLIQAAEMVRETLQLYPVGHALRTVAERQLADVEKAQIALINVESVYMTAGRDYNRYSGYEFLIGAYEVEPTQRGLDGSPFPLTLHRESGFRSNAAAKRAGIAWAAANLPGER